MSRVSSVITLLSSGLLLLPVCVSTSPLPAVSGRPEPSLHGRATAQSSRPAASQAGDSVGRRQDRAIGPPAPETLLDPHVRPTDPGARSLVEEGTRRSYTIAKLIDTIERGDVVVYVHVTSPPDGLPTSQTRLLGSGANGRRYASALIDHRLHPMRRLEMLGHELQHVVEIGEARNVTDAEGLRDLYEQIGYASWQERGFETKGAVVAQLQVRQELVAGLELTLTPRDGRVPADAAAARRRTLYDAYCAVCHGRNGKGRGLAFDALNTLTPDLTLLTRRNGGEFPRFDIERCIRAPVRSHSVASSRDMPVWSGALAVDGDPGAAAYAQDIAAHVESLQRR